MANLGTQAAAHAGPLRHFNIQQRYDDKQKLLAGIHDFMARRSKSKKKKVGAAKGAMSGATTGLSVAGPWGALIGAGAGAVAGNQLEYEVGDPEQGMGPFNMARQVAPMAGGAVGGFKNISPHESGTWTEQFNQGFGDATSRARMFAMQNPAAARAMGMDTGGMEYLPSDRAGSPSYAPPAGFKAGPGMEVTGYETTSPGEPGYTPPVNFAPQGAMQRPVALSMSPQWNSYGP